jgi:TRAP-type C4-dicarboxylate transport system substrate-binding protein
MAKIRLRFGGYQGPDSIHTAAAQAFGAKILETHSSTVNFELEQSVQDIGFKAGDLPNLVASGELDLCYISSIRFAEAVPEISIFELPYVVRDRGSLYSALDGELGRLLSARLEEETPLKVLGFWDNGFRHISNSVRPIRTPEDCQGMAIRTQMSALQGETFRAFGFNPTGTDINDFLDTIETDRFQAQENPLTSTYIFGMHKHHRYITMSGHIFGLSVFLCKRDVFEKWPPELQESVLAAAKIATAHQRKLAGEQDEIVLAKLRANGNEVTFLQPEERNAFEERVAPLRESYREKFGPALFELLGV